MGPGGTAYINDTIALHAVRCDDAACDAAGEEGAVSLHVYAPPIRRVKLFEEEENRWGGAGGAGGRGAVCGLPAVPQCGGCLVLYGSLPALLLASHHLSCTRPLLLPPLGPRRVTVRAPGFATIRGVADAELQDLSRLSSSL